MLKNYFDWEGRVSCCSFMDLRDKLLNQFPYEIVIDEAGLKNTTYNLKEIDNLVGGSWTVFFVSNGYFYFINEEDAIAFKLAWS